MIWLSRQTQIFLHLRRHHIQLLRRVAAEEQPAHLVRIFITVLERSSSLSLFPFCENHSLFGWMPQNCAWHTQLFPTISIKWKSKMLRFPCYPSVIKVDMRLKRKRIRGEQIQFNTYYSSTDIFRWKYISFIRNQLFRSHSIHAER